MTTPGYQNTGEEFIESSESHFVELEETIDEISLRVEVHLIMKSFNLPISTHHIGLVLMG